MKICKYCCKEKLLSEFCKDTASIDGKFHKCKDCVRKSSKEYRKNNPFKVKEYKLKIRYNISLDDWNKLLEKQNSLCMICKTHERDSPKGLHVDHCHKTGKIRGLLCHFCNVGLAKFKDNPDFCMNASTYLIRNKL